MPRSASPLPRLAKGRSPTSCSKSRTTCSTSALTSTPGKIDGALRIVASQVERLERDIDVMNTGLAPLESFILPGGSASVAALHLARTIVRRAERAAVALNESEKLNPQLLAYLNRLSDHLFVAARHVASTEGGDVLWKPGATRA